MKIRKVLLFCFCGCLAVCAPLAAQETGDVDLSLPMMQSPEWLLFKSISTLEARESRDLLFDQGATGFNVFVTCMWDSVQPYWTRFADNFSVPESTVIDSIVWWGGYW